MSGTDLQGGFRLGEWLVEPQEARVTGPSGAHALTGDQLRLLMELARRPGELQNRRELREHVWPGETGTDARLRDAVRGLRELLGGSAQDQRYIANVARTGLRLPRRRIAVAPAIVAGVALMAVVTGYAWWRSIDRTAQADAADFDPSPQSIAVLSFADMSPSGESAYIGDGLSEELSSDLARLPGLRVAARTSTFAYKGVDLDIRKIGRELGVRYVL